MTEQLEINYVRKMMTEAYIPFAEEDRVIAWPGDLERSENDAEHSFSLALVGMALGERLGMDPKKIAYYSTIHDLPELYAGDTSVWDDEGRITKKEREAKAVERISLEFTQTPVLKMAIEEYESQQDEESRFVYALDKLLAVIMIVECGGYFWKTQGITYQMHCEKAEEMKTKVAAHPQVELWYQELLDYISDNRDQLFPSSLG